MNEIKKLTKSTIIYFLGTVGTKLVSFLLLPLYTSYLSPTDYGTYDLNITYATLFSSFFFLDIWTGIMKFVFEKKGDSEKRSVVYSGIVIFITSTIVYGCALYGFGIVKKINYLPGVILYGFCLCLQNLYGYLARSFGYNFRFVVSGIISTICTACLNIMLLVVFGIDYKALYISYAIGILVQCFILETKLNVIWGFRFTYLDKKKLRELLTFSLPLCINSLCYWLLTGYNRVVINERLDATANGYYAVASKFGGILIIVSSCFTMAWQELAYGRYDRDEQTGVFYTKATYLYIKALICGFLVLLPIINALFPYLISQEYKTAKNLIPLNMLATLVSLLYTFLGNIISTYKKNNVIFISTLVAGVANIGLLYLLIGDMGVEAANISLLVGYLLSNIIRIWMIGQIIDYRVKWKMVLLMIFPVVVTIHVYTNYGLLANCFVFFGAMALTIMIFKDIIKYFYRLLVKRV